MTTEHKHYTDSIYYDIELTARIMKLLGAQVFEKLQIGLTPRRACGSRYYFLPSWNLPERSG